MSLFLILRWEYLISYYLNRSARGSWKSLSESLDHHFNCWVQVPTSVPRSPLNPRIAGSNPFSASDSFKKLIEFVSLHLILYCNFAKICSYRFERARRTASWPQQSQVLMAYQETYHRMDLLETLRSTWVSLGKSSAIFKFNDGSSCF